MSVKKYICFMGIFLHLVNGILAFSFSLRFLKIGNNPDTYDMCGYTVFFLLSLFFFFSCLICAFLLKGKDKYLEEFLGRYPTVSVVIGFFFLLAASYFYFSFGGGND